MYIFTNCAQLQSAESLFTRYVCPHTNCCVKSRWRLIRITRVNVSAQSYADCTGKYSLMMASSAVAIDADPDLHMNPLVALILSF